MTSDETAVAARIGLSADTLNKIAAARAAGRIK